MERGPANDWGLGIYVSPKDGYWGPDQIRRVAMKRGGQTIEPATTTLAPIQVEGERQETTQSTRGYFAFPMETLSPGADVTVVLTGSSSEVSCTIGRDKLQTLR
jgi:hypothetical protein